MLTIVLFGPPGAGKGTQAQKLIEKYNLLHVATGDILRSAIEKQNPLGMEAKKHMDKGELVPDEVVIGIVGQQLDEKIEGKGGVVFDGFPRTANQAGALDALLAERKMTIDAMIVLEVDSEEIVKRLTTRALTSGRADDQNESIIRNRIDVYNRTTRIVIDFYKAQGKYHGIDGVGDIYEIFEKITRVTEKYSN